MALTKVQIVKSIQSELGFTKNKSMDCVETIIKIMKKTLASGEDVLVSGFGKFCVHSKTKRRGRNPATGDAMMIDARRVVTFKWSGKLRRKLNGK